MIRHGTSSLLALLLLPGLSSPAEAVISGDASSLCQVATADAELSSGVPNQLLGAISRVETGRYDSAAGGMRAWPWTINAQGQGHYYASKADAVAAAHAFQNSGIRSIDVGCMQINLMYHPDGFSSIEAAFDPHANAAYAAHFLTDLFHQTGSWPHAAAAYHSQTPDLGIDYQKKVLDAWADPIDRPSAFTGHHHAGTEVASRAPPPPENSTSAGDPGASLSPAAFAPFGARPLGGFGHIVRNRPSGPSPVGGAGRGLSAYRAYPVAAAFLMPRVSRY